MIKNIIFDLGGVLLTIDYDLTQKAFEKIGYSKFHDMYSQQEANKLFQDFEKGLVSEDDFYKRMLSAGGKVSKEMIETAWTAMLLDWRASSLNFLEKLGKQYRIFLLSNTNIIHLNAFNRLLQKQTGRKSIVNLFEKAWFSNEINLRKPDKEVFDFVLRDGGIKAEETLFIDDTGINIEAAEASGFKTHLLTSREQIEDLNYHQY